MIGRVLASNLTAIARLLLGSLQLAGAAEGRKGKNDKQQADGYGESDKPVGGIPTPGAEGGIEPAESEHGKHGANYFMKELFHYAPKPPEAAWSGGVRDAWSCGNRRHLSSLTQNLLRC